MKTRSKLLTALIALCFSMISYAQIPVCNSLPSAAATVYLDFDGQFVNGTSWNYNGPIACGPSNMTNNQITEIFNRVSEDYRSFNINITTDSSKYWAAPIFQRARVILTVTSDWYGAAGGVSYVGSFNWGDNTPCFVFTALLRYNTKNVAEAASHEIGHTLGLSHQSTYDAGCLKTAEYNPGLGSGEISWAPIMGVGYYKNMTLWHNGTDPWGCSNYQDDLSIITGFANGFGYRNDDYSNTTDSATQTNFVNNRFSLNGIIEKISDKDVFKFIMPMQGNFHLDANPYSVGSGDNGSNLDIKIELLNNTQNVIGSYNPDMLLNATIDTNLNAGTYFLRVQSVGNIYAPQYATLGSYNLTAAISPTGILPLHRLELYGVNENNQHRLNWTIVADETVVQQVLEVASDGRNFQPLGQLNPAIRTFSYFPINTASYYRLNVTFDNNRQYFSNVVVLRNTTVIPNLTATLIRNSVVVNSPSAFSYAIVDYSGRTVMKGNLAQGINTINASGLGNGLYIIQYNNGQERYAEKFMKQ
jgi:hypothetical protein